MILAGGEIEKAGKDLADAGHIGGDGGIVEQLALLILARGVADARRAAAHQYYRPVPGTLPMAQQHDRYQIADMQAGRRTVETDVGGGGFRGAERIEGVDVGALVNVAALDDGADEFGTMGAHRNRPLRHRRACRVGGSLTQSPHALNAQGSHRAPSSPAKQPI